MFSIIFVMVPSSLQWIQGMWYKKTQLQNIKGHEIYIQNQI